MKDYSDEYDEFNNNNNKRRAIRKLNEEIERIEKNKENEIKKNALEESKEYIESKLKYIKLVNEYDLYFYHRVKYKHKERITEPEARIMSVQKTISIKTAKLITAKFNKCISELKKTEVQKSLDQLTSHFFKN